MLAKSLALAALCCVTAGAAFAQPAPRNLDLAGLDRSARPGEDFYAFANGGWLRTTTAPAGQASYGTTNQLVASTRDRVRALIEDAARDRPGRPPLAQQVGDDYASLLERPELGAKDLAGELAAIDAIADRAALAAYLGRTLGGEVDGVTANADHLLGLWVNQGFHDADRNRPHLWQGGLGLADRETYLDASPKAADARADYQKHVAAALRLAGVSDADAQARAERVLALEIAIARSHAPDADAADVHKQDNAWRPADFAARAPGLDWPAWFAAAGLAKQPYVIVWQPSAVTGAAALVGSQDLAVWRDYLRVHLVDQYAAALPKAPDAALAATSSALGPMVGQLYVQRWFPPPAKARARAMVAAIVAAYRPRLAHAAWMSPQTRQAALAKLATLQMGLGYPDVWPTYPGLRIVRGDAVGNLRRLEASIRARDLARLDQPVDPIDWPLGAHTVGGVILFSPNAEMFSAGILQPPYFDPDGDMAANFGSAGAGMAHEIWHSFDELGRLYDAQGRLVDWQTPQDVARYTAGGAKLAAQLDAQCPLATTCVKGAQVLGEARADLIGLSVAHDAYVASLHGKPDRVIDGLTGEQRFFIAFAQRWRKLQTEAALRAQIAGDTHAPPASRSNAVRNLDAWYAAFDVQPGDRLYLRPEDRVSPW